MLKNSKKIRFFAGLTVLCLLLLMLPLSVSADHATHTLLINYISAMVGISKEHVQTLYEEYNGNEEAFLNEIDQILADIIYYEQWDATDQTVENLNEISAQVGVTRALLERHLQIVGKDYFLRNLSVYSMSPLSGGSGSNDKIDEATFQRYYENSHSGNIYVTKDSHTLIYRHGHAGIVSKHTDPDNKMIAEALGDREDEDREVVERSLSDWKNFITLAVYYPSNTTVSQRESAGFFGGQLEYCTYTPFVKKGEAVDLMPEVNCVSLVYLAYLMASENSDYDLVPQVGNSTYLLPSQIVFSPIITLKTTGSGEMMRTANWNNYNWGF